MGSGLVARDRNVLRRRSNRLRAQQDAVQAGRAAQADVGAQAHHRPVGSAAACGFRKRTTSPTCTSTNSRGTHCCAGGARCASARRPQPRPRAASMPSRSRSASRRAADLPVRTATGIQDGPAGVDDGAPAAASTPARTEAARSPAWAPTPGSRIGTRGASARTAATSARIGRTDHQAERTVPVPATRGAAT